MAGRVRESWARGVAGLFEVRAPAAEQKRAQRPVHLRATASTVYRLPSTYHPSLCARLGPAIRATNYCDLDHQQAISTPSRTGHLLALPAPR